MEEIGHVGVTLGHVPGVLKHGGVAFEVPGVEESKHRLADSPVRVFEDIFRAFLHDYGEAIGRVRVLAEDCVFVLALEIVVMPVSRRVGGLKQEKAAVLPVVVVCPGSNREQACSYRHHRADERAHIGAKPQEWRKARRWRSRRRRGAEILPRPCPSSIEGVGRRRLSLLSAI